MDWREGKYRKEVESDFDFQVRAIVGLAFSLLQVLHKQCSVQIKPKPWCSIFGQCFPYRGENHEWEITVQCWGGWHLRLKKIPTVFSYITFSCGVFKNIHMVEMNHLSKLSNHLRVWPCFSCFSNAMIQHHNQAFWGAYSSRDNRVHHRYGVVAGRQAWR